MSIAVLDHDNRGIDKHADRERQAPERHDVARDIEKVHRNERCDDRDGNRDNRDERRADMPEEKDDDEAHDDRFGNEIALERMDGGLDEAGTVIARMNL